MSRLRRPPLGRQRDRRSRRALAEHPLLPLAFDARWYATRYRDVFRVGADPLEHLVGPGAREGRDPSPYVDVSFYLTQVPDLRAGGLEPLRHLLEVGIPEGRRTSPYVDLTWYARHHAGLATLPSDAADHVARLAHLVASAGPTHPDPSPYVDLTWYAQQFPDITQGGLDPFAYFTALGGPLRRFPHPLWDEDAYVADNEYVRFALGMGKYLHGYEHFCAVGHEEVARGAEALVVRIDGRRVEYSEERYLRANPDVAEVVAAGTLRSGVEHLFSVGHREITAGTRLITSPSQRATATLTTGGRVPTGDVLLLLVHFDVEGIVDPHVLLAVDTYTAAGIDVAAITVGVDDAALTPLTERCIAVVQRSENDALRDFGAWQLALDALGEDRVGTYDLVVLANDSAYFPACDPTTFLTELRTQRDDVWAASDSLSGGRYHVQSFFLALRQPALTVLRPELARLAREFPDPTKLSLIQRFEIGLTRFALEHGLRVGAYRSVKDLGDLAQAISPPDPRPLSQLGVTITNQTHHYWRTALTSGLPFLKVELLRDNPLRVDLTGWADELTGAPCDATVIRTHLDRVAGTGWAGRDTP
jgi:hypothetical protein